MGETSDFFVAKLDGNLSSASYAATFLGGTTGGNGGREANPAIAVDGSGIVLAGISEATDYPTTDNAYNRSGGGAQVVVSKLNNTLTSLLYSTFVGPSDLNYRVSLSLDAGDNVWIGGYASGSSFPVWPSPGAHRTTYQSKEGFVAKIDNTLSFLRASTLVGGIDNDFVTGIFAAPDGSVYATGQTASSDFAATAGAFDNSYNGVLDVFVRRYSGDLTSLQTSTFLFLSSTSTNTPRTLLTLDGSGNVYVAGITNYPSILATAGAVQENFNHPFSNFWFDGFIAKFDATLSADSTAPTVSSVNPSSGATGVPVDNAVRVIFSERMSASTIDNVTITVGGVTGTVTYDGIRTATFTPLDNLAAGTAYTVTVTIGVRDYWGNAMASAYVFTFTTASASTGSGGGGGGGCTVSGGRKVSAEEGLPATLVLLSPLVYMAAKRMSVRRSGRNR
jgi:hypothetical protein